MKIQISKIKANPNNPRQVIRQDMIDSLAMSMAEVGLKNKLKITPDAGQGHDVISGHIRLLSAIKLGWTEIECEILDLTPEQRLIEAILDNRGQSLFWLDLYTSIESLMLINPELTQKQAAERVEVTAPRASYAIKVLLLLNFQARSAIITNCKNSKDFEVSEAAIIALTDLAVHKQATIEDQALVESGVRVVLDRKMTEQQAKKLVAWVKKGNAPEAFPEDGKLSGHSGSKQQRYDQDDPYAGLWQPLDKSFQIHRTPKGYKMTLNMDAGEAPVMAYAAMAWKQALRQKREGVSGQANEYMDKLQGLLDAAAQEDVQPVKQASLATGSDSETKPGTRNEKLETLLNMGKGALKNSIPEGFWGNIVKAGLKKFLK